MGELLRQFSKGSYESTADTTTLYELRVIGKPNLSWNIWRGVIPRLPHQHAIGDWIRGASLPLYKFGSPDGYLTRPVHEGVL
jgi:hypothetical protein